MEEFVIAIMAAILSARSQGLLDYSNRVQEAVRLCAEVEKQLAASQQEGKAA